MKFTKDLTEGSIYKSFLTYAIPLLISYILSQAYSTIDAVIAGKFISENALGAISATGSYELLFQSLFSGFAAGFGIYIAQQFGKGDYGAVRRDAVTMGAVVAVAAVAVSLLSVGLRDSILNYLKVDPILRKDAEIYFIIFTLGYVFSYVNMLLLQTPVCVGLYILFPLCVLYFRGTENCGQSAGCAGAGLGRCGACLFYGAFPHGSHGLLFTDSAKSLPGAGV